VSSCCPQGQRARFFDSANFDLGCAGQVFGRTSSLGGLTVLQVMTADPTLASFFNGLDRRAMRVESVEGGRILLFKWASAYFDGKGSGCPTRGVRDFAEGLETVRARSWRCYGGQWLICWLMSASSQAFANR
jgi:hypothetical protein